MKHLRHIAAGLLALLTLAACNEEEIDLPDYTVSGEKVTLSVPVSLPVMDQRSRAALDVTQLNQIESLWVRTYSAKDGKATSDWVIQTPASTDTEVARNVTIETRSGSSYIVAVANVNNLAVTADDIDNPQPLRTLLEAADTWADFLKIAVVAPSSQEDVRAPRPPLPMCGCYSDLIVGGPHPEPARIDEWQTTNFTPYFIPAKKSTVTFNGAIHLRRLVSHINFNVQPGNDNIEVEVNSFRVMNAPCYSWLYERPDQGGMTTNFGDAATDADDATNYYADVPQFGAQFITLNPDGSSSFDFWQSENKHTGTCDTYSNRDRKTTEGNLTLFTSLTGNVWTPNNEASYVLVNCTVEYKNQINVNQQGELTDNGEAAYRTGQVTYIIHLGYIGDSPVAQRAKDFNCFRNVDYTYNLTVNGLNDIRLDAYAADATAEAYHGEEGLVVDQTQSTISIDGHYAAFNIYLTQTELSGDFGFIITTYDGGEQITLTDENIQTGSGQNIQILDAAGNPIDPKYYNWIELRPTTAEGTLAQYRPRYGANSDGNTFLLANLKGGWTNMATGWRSTSGWYTVFVNEYTYEPMYTGTDGYANEQWNGQGGRPNWMHYVNQNPRRFFLRVTQKKSPDGNSIYARSKYGISQQSLLTYYSDQTFAPASGDIPAGTAVAVERENENEGMNLRMTFLGGNSSENGRWNVAQYLNGSTTSENLSINNSNANSRPAWTTYVNMTSPMQHGAVTGLRCQGGPEIPERTVNNGNPLRIPALTILTTTGQYPAWSSNNGVAGSYTYSDPQANNSYTIEAINACMSRNRDNNGNGRIDPDELRWYVPAFSQYLVLGASAAALPVPLMNYNSITQLPRVANIPSGSVVDSQRNNISYSTTSGIYNDNSYYPRYMFVGSNNGTCVLWGLEGTSASNYEGPYNWSNRTSYPWQIRCIRNLGANLTTVTKDNKVSNTFVYDAANRTFRSTYLNASAQRTIPYTGNGSGVGLMPPHTLNSPYNRIYYGFEYAESDISVNAATAANRQSLTDYINDNPCSEKGTGWRVPNQIELNMMCNAGVFVGASTYWISCTTNYFNPSTGQGNNLTTDKYYLVSIATNGTQSSAIQGNEAVRLRCVRDIN